MLLLSIVYILQIRLAMLIVLPCLIEGAKLFLPLGFIVLSVFIRLGNLVQELVLTVVRYFRWYVKLVHLLGLTGGLQYVFLFKLTTIQILRIFSFIIYTIIFTICNFDHYVDIMLLFFFNNEFD